MYIHWQGHASRPECCANPILRKRDERRHSTTLCQNEGLRIVEEFFLARGPSSSAEVRGLVIHDMKEVEGVRQQEDKRDEEIRDEEIGEWRGRRGHSPCA